MRATWTQETEKILADNYSEKSMNDLMKLLPQFNKQQIRNKAKRMELKKEKYELHFWTEEEDKFLIENYNDLTAKEMGAKLGLSESQIRNRVCKLGIKKLDKWSEEDERIIKENYNVLSTEELSEILESKRDKSAITKKAFHLGVTSSDNRAVWSEEDEALMFQFYATKTNEELQQDYFPYYSISQIKSKAKGLGLKKTNLTRYKATLKGRQKMTDVWTEEEKQILAENYGKMNNKILRREYLPHKSMDAIRLKARKLGLQNKTYQYFIWKNVDVNLEEEDLETITFTFEKELVE